MSDAVLDAFAYPVSALMQLWHDLLRLFVPTDPWVGSILLLVLTLRLLLLPLTWVQLRSSRQLAALHPRLTALRSEHGSDRAGYLRAAGELQRAEGVTTAGCLPALVQVPVFLGLYHLLAGFSPAGTAGGNGVFGPDQVVSFAHATVAGVPLAATVRGSAAALDRLQAGLDTGDVLLVVLPLLLVAATATWLTGRVAARRQPPAVGDDAFTAGLGSALRAMVWLGPIGVVVGGLVAPVPLALVLYWAVNGCWTCVQTVLLHRRLDRRLDRTAGAG